MYGWHDLHVKIQIASRPPPGPEKEPIGSMDVKKFGSICHQKRVRIYRNICGIGHNIDKMVSDTSLKSVKEATCSDNTIFAKFFEVQLRWHGGDKRGRE